MSTDSRIESHPEQKNGTGSHTQGASPLHSGSRTPRDSALAMVASTHEHNPIPRGRSSDGNAIPRKIVSDGPVPNATSIREDPFLMALFDRLARTSRPQANLLAFEYDHTVLPMVLRLQAASARGEERVLAAIVEYNLRIEETQAKLEAMVPESLIKDLTQEVEEAKQKVARTCGLAGCSDLNVDGVLYVGPEPVRRDVRRRSVLSRIVRPTEKESRRTKPARNAPSFLLRFRRNKKSGAETLPTITSDPLERNPKPTLPALANNFMSLVVGVMTGISIFALTHWFEPSEGISNYLSPNILFGCSLLIGMGVSLGAKYAITGAFRELGLRYGARRSLYSRIVAGAIGIGLLVALLLLDAFTHREGFMVGARVYHTLYPDMPYLTDQMALCIAMIVMAGYLPSLAFYGFSDGREISHQHRLEKLYEEECLFEEQRFQAEHADWEKRREQRRKEKPVQEALAALYDLECKSTRLAQITGTRDALLASLNGLIDGRNSVARDYLPNDQKLIEDAYTNLVGSYRLWFTRVQNLVLANDPSLRQQVTFDNETFELLLPDAPARSRVRDPFMLPAEKPEQPAKRSLAARVRSWFRPSARPATE